MESPGTFVSGNILLFNMNLNILQAVKRTDEHYLEKHASFLEIIKRKEPIDILLIGDSITRRWEDNPGIFKQFFSKYKTVNFGVGSDTIENLRWRILNGELEQIQPALVVLNIGTNNLPMYTVLEIYTGIRDILRIFINKLPDSRIVLLGLLPRNNDQTGCNYMAMTEKINKKLNISIKNSNVLFIDPGKYFRETSTTVKSGLLPDGLHPAGKGYTVLGELLISYIDKLIKI